MSTNTKKMKITPRGKQVLVRVDDAESRVRESGVIVPDEVEQERKAKGVVIARGAAVGDDIKVGDHVVYGAYAGESLKIQEAGKQIDYKLLEDSDVIAFINK